LDNIHARQQENAMKRCLGSKAAQSSRSFWRLRGVWLLALMLGAVIYVSARAMGRDIDVADAVRHLVQLGTDLLNRLFLSLK
jgi:hypothetical protein